MRLSALPRALAFAALSLVALLALMAARCVLESQQHVARAERALQGRDLVLAVSEYRLAARWGAPGNAYARSALDQLERIGRAAELRGDAPLALSAYRSIHAALHASRGVRVSQPELLARSDARIAALMARERVAGPGAGPPSQPHEARYRELLQAHGPNTLGVLLACGGFFTWVGAFAVLVLRGLDREGRIVRQIARRSFLCLVFGWVAFAVGLRIA
jgi:hypothetical protein